MAKNLIILYMCIYHIGEDSYMIYNILDYPFHRKERFVGYAGKKEKKHQKEVAFNGVASYFLTDYAYYIFWNGFTFSILFPEHSG